MAFEEFQGDFLGFTFNDIHSSEFGIVRTSSSDRYTENITPTMKEISVDIPNNDGQYYYGTNFTKTDLKISFAFDSMTEEMYQKFLVWVNDKGIHKLKFDEFGEWYYMAKITSNATLKFVCFDERGVRIYKGEGQLTFTSYHPYMIQKKEVTISGTTNLALSVEENVISEPYVLNIIPASEWSGTLTFVFSDGKEARIIAPLLEQTSNALTWNQSTGMLMDNNEMIYNHWIDSYFPPLSAGEIKIRLPSNTDNFTFTFIYYIYYTKEEKGE